MDREEELKQLDLIIPILTLVFSAVSLPRLTPMENRLE